ncbi:MAG: hypothetical protein AAGA90_17060 [Actinomycetota bacterium]
MRGKWAQGIEPRHFTWVIKDKVAVCERPGGYGVNHRKVRRQEEIIWLRQNEFDFVMSLCGSNQNLHNYEEMGLPFHHVPFSGPAAGPLSLTRAMASIRDHVQAGDKIIVHREMLGERITGLVAAYLLWMELVPDGPQAISITERLFERELGQVARELVAMVEKCDPSAEVPTDAFVSVPDEEIDPGVDDEDDD